jgi:hypothetical protein
MGGQFWRRRFRAAATGISLDRVRSRFSRKNEPITRACMEKLSMRAGTRLWRTPTPTCLFLPEENLFLRQCITSCDSQEPTECTPDTCPAIPRGTAVSECLSSMRSRFSIRSALALQSLCSAGRRSGAIWGNRNPHFCGAATDLEVRASTRDLVHLRRLGGDKAKSLLPVRG